MFRKIQSNRDPNKTVWTETAAMYKPYLDKGKKWFTTRMETNPMLIFKAMVAVMSLSIIILVILASTKPEISDDDIVVSTENQHTGGKNFLSTPSDGLGAIMNAGSSIKKLMQIKENIKYLLDKPQLTHQDSTILLENLTELEKLENTSKKLKDESRF